MTIKSDRRLFIGSSLAAAMASVLPRGTGARAATGSHSPDERLSELGIVLPEAPNPIATYVTTVISGNMLYLSGHGPADIEGVKRGKVGADLTIEEGNRAAYATALNVLATMQNRLGSLDQVTRLVRTLGMVNAAPDFTDQPKVVNGFSDLMVQVFGDEAGKGVRAAVGMGSLPGNIAVEIETIWELRD